MRVNLIVPFAEKAHLTHQCQVCFNFDMDSNTIINALGGTNKVARICGISAQAVSQWRTSGIPLPWMKFFQAKYASVFKKLRQAA